MAKLADALDSKSSGVHSSCGFESHLRHQRPSHTSELPPIHQEGSIVTRFSIAAAMALAFAPAPLGVQQTDRIDNSDRTGNPVHLGAELPEVLA